MYKNALINKSSSPRSGNKIDYKCNYCNYYNYTNPNAGFENVPDKLATIKRHDQDKKKIKFYCFIFHDVNIIDYQHETSQNSSSS